MIKLKEKTAIQKMNETNQRILAQAVVMETKETGGRAGLILAIKRHLELDC
jgi:hypothetical protein